MKPASTPPCGGDWRWPSSPLAGDPNTLAGLARYGIRIIADIDSPFRPGA
jgi:hypothetical protein